MKSIQNLIRTVAIGAVLASCSTQNREIIQLPDGTTYRVTYQTEGDSIKTGHYEDGTLYYKSLKQKGFSNSTETESFTYYPDGKIRKYAFLINDSLRYFRFYDKEGNTTETGGCALVYLDNEVQYVDTINKYEPYFHQIRIAIPPFSKARILYGDEVENEENRDQSQNPLTFLPLKGNLSGMLVKVETTGVYNKVLYWSLEDTVTNSIEKGRVWRQFIVL